MIVNIEQKHLDAGEPGHADRCAIALAMREAGLDNASADMTMINYMDSDEGEIGLEPSSEVRELILAFDRGDTLQPFSIDLADGIAWLIPEDC